MEKKIEIRLPEGTFCGNCRDCRYADWSNTDSYGCLLYTSRSYSHS